jgi:hypothetical protein
MGFGWSFFAQNSKNSLRSLGKSPKTAETRSEVRKLMRPVYLHMKY